MIFSNRLYGIGGASIFLIYSTGTLLSVASHLRGQAGLILIIILIVLFVMTGTWGWRAALRRGERAVALYFVVQIALCSTIFLLENWVSRDGAASNLATLLILQSVVWSAWRTRFVIFAFLNLSMGVISLFFISVDAVLFGTITLFIINGAVLLIGDLIVKEERSRRQLAEVHQQLTAYAAQVEELATMRERNRLAHEIHDSLGHYLTIVNVQIEVAKTFMGQDSEQALVAMNHAQRLTQEGLTAVRHSVAVLRDSATSRNPLHESITQLVEEHRAAGLNVNYQLEGDARTLSEDLSLTLYRVAQEALTNIRRHAQANQTDLCLRYEKNRRVSLCIQDDGVGSDKTHVGYGLVGIQERIQWLGGKVEIETSPGRGFRLCVEVAG